MKQDNSPSIETLISHYVERIETSAERISATVTDEAALDLMSSVMDEYHEAMQLDEETSLLKRLKYFNNTLAKIKDGN